MIDFTGILSLKIPCFLQDVDGVSSTFLTCTGGSLVDALRLLNGKQLSVPQVATIMYQTTRAVQHMQVCALVVCHGIYCGGTVLMAVFSICIRMF